MNDSNRWLFWKEARGLAPLVVMIAAVGVILLVSLRVSSSDKEFRDLFSFIAIVIPLLYAVGVGPVMVGQERELKTLGFLMTLPIGPAKINTFKILVSLVGLAVLWVLVSASIWFFRPPEAGPVMGSDSWLAVTSGGPARLLLWMVHSVYFVFASFYAAWRVRNVLLSVVVSGVLAFVPILIGWGVAFLFAGRSDFETGTYLCVLATTAVSIPVVALASRRRAMKTMSSHPAPVLPVTAARKDLDMAVVRHDASEFDFTSDFAAMRWQGETSGWSLGTKVAMLIAGILVALALALLLRPGPGAQGASLVVSGGIFLVVSWIGVSVFQGDGSARSLRFLADRGISPRRVFWYRHAVPATWVVRVVLGYLFFAIFLVTLDPGVSGLWNLFSLATVLMFCLPVYSISQWASQLVPASVISYLLAPLLSVAGVMWLIFCGERFAVPLPLLMLLALLPVVVTYRMMPRFMDQTDRWRGPIAGVGLVMAFVLIPMGYALMSQLSGWGVAGWPLRVRTIVAIRAYDSQIREFEPFPGFAEADLETQAEWALLPKPVTMDELIDQVQIRRAVNLERIGGREMLVERPEVVFVFEDDALNAVMSRLNFERLRFEANPEEEATRESYRWWLGAASVAAGDLRRSVGWQASEQADQVEIWIADATSQPEVEEVYGREFVGEVIGRLPTKEERNRSRLAAVQMNWFPLQRDTETLIEVAESLEGDGELSENDLAMLNELFGDPSVPLELSVHGPLFRSRDASTLVNHLRYGGLGARFWAMGWENEIEVLRKRFVSNSSEGNQR